MKKTIFSIFLGMMSVALSAQTPISIFFQSMPDSLLPLVNQQARSVLLNAHALGTASVAHDALGTEVRLDTMTADFLHLRTSSISWMQLRLLHTMDSIPLIVLIETVQAPSPHSSIRFFNTQWTPQHWVDFPLPQISDFLSQRAAPHFEAQLAQLPLIEIVAQADAPLFTLSLSDSELDKEARITLQLRPLHLRWDGEGFVNAD